MMRAPDQTIFYGISLPGAATPAAVCNGHDVAGASWIADRLNRLALFENSLEGLCVSLAAVIVGNPNAALYARDLYDKTHALLVLNASIVPRETPLREGEG